jgi:hypothetical protein
MPKRHLMLSLDAGHPMYGQTPFTPVLDALRLVGLKFPAEPVESAEELARLVETAARNFAAGRRKAQETGWDDDDTPLVDRLPPGEGVRFDAP